MGIHLLMVWLTQVSLRVKLDDAAVAYRGERQESRLSSMKEGFITQPLWIVGVRG